MAEGELLAGKYMLLEKLGAGGMGEVWRARNVALEREVAIKVLLSEHAKNREVAERFLREARAANRVRHPNVVDVLDVGQGPDGAPFLVQELLEGVDLAQHVAGSGGRLQAEEALAVFIPIVEAVAHAHAKGVVHRDIKPENVFLARQAGGVVVPKLLDFGISHVVAHATTATRLTAVGVAMGTPAFMSPEQIMGARDVDARADVWALGVLMYDVLSGGLPFKAETQSALFVEIATSRPEPLDRAAPGVPPALVRVVHRCLTRSREERYADGRQLLVDLRAAAQAPYATENTPAAPGAYAELDVPSLPAPPGARVSPQPRESHSGGTREIEIEPISAGRPALQVASVPPQPAPPPPAPPPPGRSAPLALAKLRASFRPSATDEDVQRWTAGSVLVLVVLFAGGVVTWANPWREQLALGQIELSIFAGTPEAPARAGAAILVAIAALLGVRGWRLQPRSWGHLVAAAGLGAMSAIVVASSTGQATASALPWASALVAAGLAVVALRRAIEAWIESWWANVAVYAAAATAALFAAAQFVR